MISEQSVKWALTCEPALIGDIPIVRAIKAASDSPIGRAANVVTVVTAKSAPTILEARIRQREL
jgi:hypothetical protein